MKIEFPLMEPAYIADPTPYWKILRENDPIYWSEKYNFWVVTKYEDVEAFVKDYKTFSSASGPAGGLHQKEEDDANGVGFLPMIQNDPPEHGRLRSLLSRSFTSRRISDLAPSVHSLAKDLVSDLNAKAAAGEPLDFYHDFASPLPVAVIAKLLGIPKDYYEKLAFWNEAMGIGTGGRYSETQRSSATSELTQALREIIELKRIKPEEDMISSLVQIADDDGVKLKPNELLGFCKLLWIAGNETTTNLLSNSALLLQEKPDLVRELIDDKSLIPAFIEEALRHQSPVNGLFRRVTRDYEYKGKLLKENDNVWLLFASANRDKEVFSNPDEFDLRRDPNDHLALGKGIHFCMGHALARLEAEVAFEYLVEFLPKYKLLPEEGLRIPVPVLRGWLKLPMVPA